MIRCADRAGSWSASLKAASQERPQPRPAAPVGEPPRKAPLARAAPSSICPLSAFAVLAAAGRGRPRADLGARTPCDCLSLLRPTQIGSSRTDCRIHPSTGRWAAVPRPFKAIPRKTTGLGHVDGRPMAVLAGTHNPGGSPTDTGLPPWSTSRSGRSCAFSGRPGWQRGTPGKQPVRSGGHDQDRDHPEGPKHPQQRLEPARRAGDGR